MQNGNPDVDIGVLICTAVGDDTIPYDVPPVTWGDSTQLGVGDRVLIGGYPLGKDMFLALSTNRGIVQPTFYDGNVSAIIPATKNTETRLIQISTISMGGISGGVVCDPTSGAVLGMVTSGLETVNSLTQARRRSIHGGFTASLSTVAFQIPLGNETEGIVVLDRVGNGERLRSRYQASAFSLNDLRDPNFRR